MSPKLKTTRRTGRTYPSVNAMLRGEAALNGGKADALIDRMADQLMVDHTNALFEIAALLKLRSMVSNLLFQYDCAKSMGANGIDMDGPMVLDIRRQVELTALKS